MRVTVAVVLMVAVLTGGFTTTPYGGNATSFHCRPDGDGAGLITTVARFDPTAMAVIVTPIGG